MEKENKNDVTVDPNLQVPVYKWMKIAQCIVLAALGVIFIVCAINTDGLNLDYGFWISVGVVAVVYGVMDVLAGYLLTRNLISSDILMGVLGIALGITFFFSGKNDSQAISELLNYFLVSVLFLYALLSILFGVDRCVGKNGVKRKIPAAVLSFILAAVLLALAICYIVFILKGVRLSDGRDSKAVIGKYIVVIFGAVLVILAIVQLVTLLIKVKNTNEMMKEEKAMASAQTSKNAGASKDSPTVIDYTEMKDEMTKERRKKGRKNKEIQHTASKEPEVIDVSDQGMSKDDGENPKSLPNGNDQPDGNPEPKK